MSDASKVTRDGGRVGSLMIGPAALSPWSMDRFERGVHDGRLNIGCVGSGVLSLLGKEKVDLRFSAASKLSVVGAVVMMEGGATAFEFVRGLKLKLR